MNATVKLTEETAHQMSTVGKILLWLQGHPNACKNTHHLLLAKTMENEIRIKNSTIRGNLRRMVDREMLHQYNFHGSQRYRDVYINYYHPYIPPYVMANAPEDIKEKVKKYRDLASNQYLDDKGIKTTRLEREKRIVTHPRLKQEVCDYLFRHPDGVEGKTIRGIAQGIARDLGSKDNSTRATLTTLIKMGKVITKPMIKQNGEVYVTANLSDEERSTLAFKQLAETEPATWQPDSVQEQTTEMQTKTHTETHTETDDSEEQKRGQEHTSPVQVVPLEEPVVVKTEPAEEPVQPTSIKLEQTKDGLNLTITLNLNLNF